uniref:Uncharacterized protein n=1 Tax=Skeletonema marinoi TaxID=267567 RepID=A0A7S2Q2A3_9STRA|mmetsp:Transcript_8300/g.14045  ORF Transcript_8300/g.14045 Transcript_8300/m.14045 type:complete len:534 (+) Transcript_8300:56-1657(+)
MRTRRSGSNAFTLSSVIGTCTDEDDPSRQWEDAFVDFLFGAAQTINKPAVVVLQTNDWKGLSQVTELSPMDYAYLLLGTGIVTVHEKNNMHNDVEVHEDKLKDMLRRRNIMGDKEGESYCFVSEGRVYEGALGEKWDGTVVSKTKEVRMLTLRIGKPPAGGKAPPGQASINKRDPPPRFNWKMRRVHQAFHRKIGPLTTASYFDEKMRSDARVVRDWMIDPPQLFNRKRINRVDVTREDKSAKSPEKKKTKKTMDTTIDAPSLAAGWDEQKMPSSEFKDAGKPTNPAGGMKTKEVTPEFKADLMAIMKKHGMLDELEQSMEGKANDETSATSREETTPNTTKIPEPPQRNRVTVTPTESEKAQYPVLSQLDPAVLRRGEKCVAGMDLDEIRSDALLRELLKLKTHHGEEPGFESANSRTHHTLLDVPMTIKDNAKVVDLEEVAKTNASAEKLTAIAEKTNLVDNEIPRLVEENKRVKSTWEMFDKDISVLSVKLKEYSKNRRTEEASYYTGVDRIFQDEGANRAAHFGRKFMG